MADVIVAGAGIIGLTTAWRLVERGWNVTVCDPAPASGATRAAAGMLAPASEVVWGQPSLYPLMVESARRYADLVERLVPGRPEEVGYLPTETLVVAADHADRAALDELTALQASLGLRAVRVSSLAARRLEGALAPGIAGGVSLPDDHQIDPRAMCVALIEALGDRVIRSEVAGLLREDGATRGVRLVDGTEHRGDQVVLCTGLGSLPELPLLPLRPVYGDILRLEPSRGARPLLTRTVRGLVRGRSVYLVPRRDGSLVLGATTREDDDPRPSAEGVHRLLDDAWRLVPGVLDTRLVETMTRARPGTPDDVPLVGRLDPGLVVSTGYFRHGILLAPLGSEVTADLVDRLPVEPGMLAALDPYRFDRSDPTTGGAP
ncbi:glycine oxidase ThiO [Aeromicrobium piscarium]|uniref:glycine oxidase n=1 Tax=Aeromicrobium piscarium TaxID=2590901 RepID=A0A554RJP5_9ACTN|nr:glycine oxidase ThiO [Aeromicrobium piscarium]TSD54378.1 glycine oxidase ThiO [Aeromicrobium piscarium]